MFVTARKLAMLEQMIVDHLKDCERARHTAERKADKLESKIDCLDSTIDKVRETFAELTERNHKENQRWLRSLAGAVIAGIILTLIKAHLNL